jgi:transcriptional regulator with XRE-family HTH domain
MDTFGDKLRTEREDRGLSIQAVAEILGVDHDLLLALDRNDFAALPDEAVMMDCLHAYAECLQVDADLMIEDYVRERDRCLRRLEDVVVQQVAEAAPAAIPVKTERRPRFSPWLVGLVVVAIAMLAGWWMLSRDGTEPTPERSVATTPVEPQPLSSKTPAGVAPTPVEPPAAQSAPTTPAPLLLSVTDYGVGTAVENRHLVGKSDRFTEGTQVWFWTRVQGGTRGHRIEHVWFREGVEAMRISLQIGGPSWRTFSTKTLQAGVAGDWAVEARDDAGRVLARSEFVCVP